MRASLAVNHLSEQFSSTTFVRLMSTLTECEKNTIVHPIDSLNQLLLGPDFTTLSGGCRMTWYALRQCCMFMSKSFYKTLVDLSGKKAAKEHRQTAYSPRDAVTVFNIMLKRRFDKCLYGKRLVKNVATNTIESVVDSSYFRLSNLKFANMVNDRMNSKKDFVFHSAFIEGKRVQLRFINVNPLETTHVSEGAGISEIKHGLVFDNSENAGSNTKVTCFFEIDSDKHVMIPYAKHLSRRHRSYDLEEKAKFLIELADSQLVIPSIDEIEKKLVDLIEYNLGLTGKRTHDNQFLRLMANRIYGQVIPATNANSIARNVTSFGSSALTVDDMKAVREAEWPLRTALDVFTAIAAESAFTKTIAARDNIEQLGFKVLFGDWRIIHGLKGRSVSCGTSSQPESGECSGEGEGRSIDNGRTDVPMAQSQGTSNYEG